MKWLKWVLLLGSLIGIGILITTPATMQCSIQTDWPSYTIVRGDTLYSIAQRHNTTTTTLLTGNCLSNGSRILVGQQIRVPPNDTISTATPTFPTVPESPRSNFIVGATYQQFEHGFMTWRSDSGAIWVFYGNGHVVSYPLHVYGGLATRSYMGVRIPSGHGLPTHGFRRVYDNFPEVRERVGWAIGDPEGYDMLLTVPPFGGGFFTMSVPSGQQWSITDEGIWGHVTGVPIPSTTPTPAANQGTTGATSQAFEHGFMVWREDIGDISVFVGQDNGELTTYPVTQYGGLPLRSYTPPTSHWYPTFGFGKVWGNISGVRQELGWALGAERGYKMILAAFDSSGNLTSFSLPDGRFLTQSSGTTWIITPSGVLVNP